MTSSAESKACAKCGCVGGDECEHLNCSCWTPKGSAASGLWRREDGSVMVPMNLHRASLRERLYVIGLTWRACHHVRLTLTVIRTYLRPSAQVCDYEQWEVRNV